MKIKKIDNWTKYCLGAMAVSGMLLLTACDNSNRTTDTSETEIEADPETGMGDADGVGIEGSTNVDTVETDTTSFQ